MERQADSGYVLMPNRPVRTVVGRDVERCLQLRRRRSRVPWIYAVYHARERGLDVWPDTCSLESRRSGSAESWDQVDLFDAPEA